MSVAKYGVIVEKQATRGYTMNYAMMTVKELKAVLKEKNIKGRSKATTKNEILKLLCAEKTNPVVAKQVLKRIDDFSESDYNNYVDLKAVYNPKNIKNVLKAFKKHKKYASLIGDLRTTDAEKLRDMLYKLAFSFLNIELDSCLTIRKSMFNVEVQGWEPSCFGNHSSARSAVRMILLGRNGLDTLDKVIDFVQTQDV